MDLVEKLAAEGHLTDEQVERIGRNVREFMNEVEKDPAFFKEALEKTSGADGVRDFFSRAGTQLGDALPWALGSAGAAMLVGGAINAGSAAARSLSNIYGKSSAYKSMMEENPGLRDADPNITEKAFNTLYRFNPEYAKDPFVAGTFVKTVVDQERMDLGTVGSLVSSQKALLEIEKGRSVDPVALLSKSIPQPGARRSIERLEESHDWAREEADRKRKTP
jgi:hypothetical protein